MVKNNNPQTFTVRVKTYEEPKPESKGKGGLVVAIIVAVVAIVIGGGLYFWKKHRDAKLSHALH